MKNFSSRKILTPFYHLRNFFCPKTDSKRVSTVSSPDNTHTHTHRRVLNSEPIQKPQPQPHRKCKNLIFEGMANSLMIRIRKTEAVSPPIDEVVEYLKWVRRNILLHMNCFVLSFGYLRRLVWTLREKDALIDVGRRSEKSFVLTRSNWKLMVITAIMIAHKFSDDESYFAIEFAKLLKPEYTIKQLNRMEVDFLNGLKWDCSFTPQEYQDYHRCILGRAPSVKSSQLLEF